MRQLRAGVTPYGVGIVFTEDKDGSLSGTVSIGRSEPPEEFLRKVWEMLARDGSPARFREAFGMVDALYIVGCITAVNAYSWKYKMIYQCPGHLPCGLRWCAYCGDLPPDESNEEAWTEDNWRYLHGPGLEAGGSLKL